MVASGEVSKKIPSMNIEEINASFATPVKFYVTYNTRILPIVILRMTGKIDS